MGENDLERIAWVREEIGRFGRDACNAMCTALFVDT